METEINKSGQELNVSGKMATEPLRKDVRLEKRRTRFGGKRLLLALITLVVLVALGISWSWWLFGRSHAFNEDKNINKDEFQAIFLTNGQVYFGKLANLNNKYVTITDIYYLQVQQNTSLQGASNSTAANSQV